MADNAEKDKKDNSFMMKLATLIVDKRKGFYLIFIVLCIFCVLSMNRVKVNNDLTTYLPDTTETRRGLDLMDSEFTTYGSARILICNVTFDEAQKLADQVEEMDGVSMLDFDDTEDHYHDMEALLSVTLMRKQTRKLHSSIWMRYWMHCPIMMFTILPISVRKSVTRMT